MTSLRDLIGRVFAPRRAQAERVPPVMPARLFHRPDGPGPITRERGKQEPTAAPHRQQAPEPQHQLPAEPVRRKLWQDMTAEAEANHARAQRGGPGDEHIMRLRLQIEETKARGDRGENVAERLHELRRSHYQMTGASGG